MDGFGSGGPGQAWSIHAATFDHETRPRYVVLVPAVTSRQPTNLKNPIPFRCYFVWLPHFARTNDVGSKPATVGPWRRLGQWAHAPTHQLSVTSPLLPVPVSSDSGQPHRQPPTAEPTKTDPAIAPQPECARYNAQFTLRRFLVGPGVRERRDSQ